MFRREHLELINKRGRYLINGLDINIVIKDIKAAYGNTRVMIEPVSGDRNVWVNLNSVNDVNGKPFKL